ncbi:hypothetical protein CGLO_11860 [Colletotrichum gloeosporioides Cg-14]|uniref:Uncharacterized protein n=1 Tax=Colletotrichum gloeosporioides (strain Cg-14) TaxID=1237896 RepID=T0KA39_COLGC|nr:hypothetical protein CGLO_11860 [Colletotrichum gloeosporioides Cg-14]
MAKTRSRGVEWQAAGDGGDDMASDKRAAMKAANQHSMAWIVPASGNGIIAWVMRSETLGLMTVSCLSFRGIRAISILSRVPRSLGFVA